MRRAASAPHSVARSADVATRPALSRSAARRRGRRPGPRRLSSGNPKAYRGVRKNGPIMNATPNNALQRTRSAPLRSPLSAEPLGNR